MLRQTERLTRLISQLLDLARLEAGTSPLTLRRFSVPDLLETVKAEAELAQHATEVRLEYPENLAMTGDPERLHQLMANLLENALRHSPDD